MEEANTEPAPAAPERPDHYTYQVFLGAEHMQSFRAAVGLYEQFAQLEHEMVRFLKSVSKLYLESLRRKRDNFASRGSASTFLVSAIDRKLASMHESIEAGIFKGASLYPLVLDQLPADPAELAVASAPAAIVALPPAPIRIEGIEIRDPVLRSRCRDLFGQFSQGSEHDRLDTVIREATSILEDRLRAISGAESKVIGVDFAKFAFSGPTPRLKVSENTAAQEGAHMFCRGHFGFVRNGAGHRLLGPSAPARAPDRRDD